MKIIYEGKTKTGKDIIVRYPDISDLENLLNFINTISDERTFITYQGEHETLESEGKWLRGLLERIENKKSTHLLVYCGSELVGQCGIELKSKTSKHIGVLGITIAKNFRGEGIGKLIFDLTLKEAIKALPDLKIITLEVYSTNEIARELYKKMGFVEYGILPGGVSRNNTFEDAILMYKNVSE